MGTINAGDLRHRIEIQENVAPLSPDGNRNEYNEVPPKWESRGYRWAAFMPLSESEALTAEQVQGFRNSKVVLRYFRGLSAKKHRIRFKGRTFNISSVLTPNEISEAMELVVTEKV